MSVVVIKVTLPTLAEARRQDVSAALITYDVFPAFCELSVEQMLYH